MRKRMGADALTLTLAVASLLFPCCTLQVSLHGFGRGAYRRDGCLQLSSRDAEFLRPVLDFVVLVNVDAIRSGDPVLVLSSLMVFSGVWSKSVSTQYTANDQQSDGFLLRRSDPIRAGLYRLHDTLP
jgi:hypothetical protein